MKVSLLMLVGVLNKWVIRGEVSLEGWLCFEIQAKKKYAQDDDPMGEGLLKYNPESDLSTCQSTIR
jgi:hypothetical protein